MVSADGVEWSAQMISPTDDFGGAPFLRTEIALAAGHGAVAAAALHISSLGVFEAYLDGVAISDDVLSPGWSSYEWRVRYRTYEVGDRLRHGAVLGAQLGNGWYRGRLGWTGRRAFYGDRLGLIAQLEVTYADGTTQTFGTDATWTAGPSPVVSNDLYDGQTIDARRGRDDGMRPGPVPRGGVGVDVLEFDTHRLCPYVGPPVRRRGTIRPVEVLTSPSGSTLVDFGRNIVGWTRLTARAEAGTEVTVRHAEVLEGGELGTRPLRTALATDRYICSGDDDVFEPTMTFHGFRYAEVTGWPAEQLATDLEAVVVHSDLRRTGSFACSDPLLNQLHQNVVWSMEGNFLDLPTDCPQRDERLGWTGDISVFAPTAAFVYDVRGFLADWLLDLAAEQHAQDGLVPSVVPDVLKFGPGVDLPGLDSTAIWSDAAVWVPWALWQAYGDRSILDTQYPSMAAHVRRIMGQCDEDGRWNHGFQYGDWLDPDAPPDQPWAAKAHPRLVATACLHRTALLAADAAMLTGHEDDAEAFAALAARTRSSFHRRFVDADGTIRGDAPTSYALAIAFGLLDGAQRLGAGDRLAELVAANGHRIATGFAGTPFIADALTSTGHVDVAYELLLQQECPSWLYPVTMGATTIWERWDSMLPDGSINVGQMTSFNHYALGAVADWMHRTIGGIAPLEPGYARVRIAPRPGGGLTWARAGLDSRFGTIACEWHLEADRLAVSATVPDGTTALLDLAGHPPVDLGPGRHERSVVVPRTR